VTSEGSHVLPGRSAPRGPTSDRSPPTEQSMTGGTGAAAAVRASNPMRGATRV